MIQKNTPVFFWLIALAVLLLSACNSPVTNSPTNSRPNAQPAPLSGQTSPIIQNTITSSPLSAPATSAPIYKQNGGTQTLTNQTYSATADDESAVYVTNGGEFTLSDATITTGGNSSSADKSSFYGLNAAVLANAGGIIHLDNSAVTTSGSGANGVFAEGNGSFITLANVTINAAGQYAHGVMATNGGRLNLTNVDMTTAGSSSGAIATDRGGGTIAATGGHITTTGPNSPGIYSTGNISVDNAVITATGSEAAVIEGANYITLTNTALTSTKTDKWGVMIYQSMSGDAEGRKGIFTMTGGSLAHTANDGPLFYVTNSTGIITLNGVDVTAASGVLVKAVTGSWGAPQAGGPQGQGDTPPAPPSGNGGPQGQGDTPPAPPAGNGGPGGTTASAGGTVVFTANGQTLAGDMVTDDTGSITAVLQNKSTLTGALNPTNTTKLMNLTLDTSSGWNVTADSYLTCLSDTDGISGSTVTNITGNNHTVYYRSNACAALDGQTYTLNGGGTLQPAD